MDRLLMSALLLAIIAMVTACVPGQPESPSAETVTLYVGPELVDCVGVGPQKCMLVKTEPDAEYTYFYDQIEGFEVEEGYAYELLVQVEPVKNPPADASSLSYALIEIADKQPTTQ